MNGRSARLRARHRRVFAWSLGVAVLLHGAAVVVWPGFGADPHWAPDDPGGPEDGGDATPTHLTVLFGPPEILAKDGGIVREERRLEAEHVLALPRACASGEVGRLPTRGRVGLRVWRSGRVDVRELVEGTGTACGDALITAVADALWYRWLPSERFPAPLDLIQPVTVLEPGD